MMKAPLHMGSRSVLAIVEFKEMFCSALIQASFPGKADCLVARQILGGGVFTRVEKRHQELPTRD
jgi:hypothetical protein